MTHIRQSFRLKSSRNTRRCEVFRDSKHQFINVTILYHINIDQGWIIHWWSRLCWWSGSRWRLTLYPYMCSVCRYLIFLFSAAVTFHFTTFRDKCYFVDLHAALEPKYLFWMYLFYSAMKKKRSVDSHKI